MITYEHVCSLGVKDATKMIECGGLTEYDRARIMNRIGWLTLDLKMITYWRKEMTRLWCLAAMEST